MITFTVENIVRTDRNKASTHFQITLLEDGLEQPSQPGQPSPERLTFQFGTTDPARGEKFAVGKKFVLTEAGEA